MRAALLKQEKPKLFSKHYRKVIRSSMAAQDYVLSGQYSIAVQSQGARKIYPLWDRPGYKENGAQYGFRYYTVPSAITFTPEYYAPNPAPADKTMYMIRCDELHAGLIWELAESFHNDVENGIITPTGKIKNLKLLPQSEVLRSYHNRENWKASRMLKRLQPEQVQVLLAWMQNHR